MVQIPPIGLICPCMPLSWGAKMGPYKSTTLQIASALLPREVSLPFTTGKNVKGLSVQAGGPRCEAAGP